METKVKDLTVEELQTLISDTVKKTMEDLGEDIVSLTSEGYLRSIEESRRDYKEGKTKRLEEVFTKGRRLTSILEGERPC